MAINQMKTENTQQQAPSAYFNDIVTDIENSLSAVSNAAFDVEYHYTSDGTEAGYALTLTNGVVLDRAVIRDAYRRGLISSVSNLVDSAVVSSYQYGYDTLAHATSRNDDAFGYNARSEVSTALILSNAYTYAYDNIGNHTTSSVDSVTTTYTANSLNQYLQLSVPSVPSVENLSYDLDGNLLTNGVFSYTYDAENRLATTCSNSVCVVSNAYDYMNRRVMKVSHGGTVTRRFIYDGWNLIQETIATASGVMTNAYIWGKDLSGTMQGAGGVGGLLAVKQDNVWYFPFSDANGNITAYVNESGTVVAEYTYNAFGDTIAQSSSMANAFAFRFSTKYYDSETGLYYYGYRFYSPNLHRWINRDPIEEKGGVNVYGFCGNNGVNQMDIFGLEWKVERRHLGWAKATRTSLSDSLFILGQDVMLWHESAMKWARKDMNGTKFSSKKELDDACEIYIPNKVLLVLPESPFMPPTGWGLFISLSRQVQMNKMRQKLWDYAHLYEDKGFAINVVDFSLEKGRSTKMGLCEDVGWPLFGFLTGGHGNWGGIIIGGDFVEPNDFRDPARGGYGFGLVYAFGCFQGMVPWQDLVSANGYWYVSPALPTSQYVMPSPRVPNK